MLTLFTVGQEHAAAGKNKGQIVADCLEMNLQALHML
jgi:hypothetical protein